MQDILHKLTFYQLIYHNISLHHFIFLFDIFNGRFFDFQILVSLKQSWKLKSPICLCRYIKNEIHSDMKYSLFSFSLSYFFRFRKPYTLLERSPLLIDISRFFILIFYVLVCGLFIPFSIVYINLISWLFCIEFVFFILAFLLYFLDYLEILYSYGNICIRIRSKWSNSVSR